IVPNSPKTRFHLNPSPASAFEYDFSGTLIPYCWIQHVNPLFVIGRDEIAAKRSGSGFFISKGVPSMSLLVSGFLGTTFDEALVALARGVLSSSLSGGKSSPGFTSEALVIFTV